MATCKKLSIATAAFIALGSLMPAKALAFSIVSEVSGSPTPPIINGQSLQNGDFLIRPIQDFVLTLGDGIDEHTSWNFDFTNDPNYEVFTGSTDLASAVLTLTLTPKSGLITTDTTGIPGVTGIAIPNIPGIPSLGQTDTITLNLFDYGFTSQQIMGVFASNNGIIPWVYQDDAIISSARLELKAVPEPTSTLGLLALGAFGVAAGFKGKQKSTTSIIPKS
ncbi:MAG: PEP-CTERM sorting domain-containing protein [Phormidium sp.]